MVKSYNYIFSEKETISRKVALIVKKNELLTLVINLFLKVYLFVLVSEVGLESSIVLSL